MAGSILFNSHFQSQLIILSLCEFLGNSKNDKDFDKYFGYFWGILLEFFWNSLGILLEFLGNTLENS